MSTTSTTVAVRTPPTTRTRTTAYPTQRCLPLELVLEIVDSLALPSSPSSYTHPPDVLATLLSLCLVSRAVSRVAIRHLYSRIYLRTPSQLRAFFDHPSRPSRAHLTHALGFAPGIPLSSIDVHHISFLYGPHLQRLDLEGQIHWFTPSPKHGAPPTSHLDELALIPGGQRYPLEMFANWTPFPKLKRLAFMHAVLHDHSDNPGYYARLEGMFPQLEVLVLTLPARSRRQLASFAHLLSCLPRLRKAILIEPCPPSASRRLSSPSPPSSPLLSPSALPSPTNSPTASPTQTQAQLSIEELEESIGKSLLSRRPSPCEIHEVLATAHGCPEGVEGKRAFKPWFAGVVREGRVWGLEGRVWGRREVVEEGEGEDGEGEVSPVEMVTLEC